MFTWFSSFWTSNDFGGPARNAPNNGFGIKGLLEQRPQHVILVSASEISAHKSKLRPTIINGIPPLSSKPPLLKEFDGVFDEGYKNYFAKLRQKREALFVEEVQRQIEEINKLEDASQDITKFEEIVEII